MFCLHRPDPKIFIFIDPPLASLVFKCSRSITVYYFVYIYCFISHTRFTISSLFLTMSLSSSKIRITSPSKNNNKNVFTRIASMRSSAPSNFTGAGPRLQRKLDPYASLHTWTVPSILPSLLAAQAAASLPSQSSDSSEIAPVSATEPVSHRPIADELATSSDAYSILQVGEGLKTKVNNTIVCYSLIVCGTT